MPADADKDQAIRDELVRIAESGTTIMYGELGKRVGMSAQGPWKPVLDRIGRSEVEAGRPDLTYLVVRKATGVPAQVDFEDARLPSDQQRRRAEEVTQSVWAFYKEGHRSMDERQGQMAKREIFVRAVQVLTNRLAELHLAHPFRLAPGGPEEIEAGWNSLVARLGPGRPNIYLFYDLSLDGETPVFWVGYYSSQAQPIQRLVSDLSALYPNVRTLSRKDVVRKNGMDVFAEIPDGAEVEGQAFQESYGRENYFGCYGVRNEGMPVARFVQFLLTTIRALPEFESDAEEFTKVENRRVVGLHLRFDRDPRLARICKERDNFRCQVCGFDYVSGYGEIGRGFAEAHHIVPLSKLEEPTATKLEDLITVCANCHRMLHRMDGEADDVAHLRKILRQS